MLQPFLQSLVNGDALPPCAMIVVDRITLPNVEDRLRVESEWVGLEAIDRSYRDCVRPLLIASSRSRNRDATVGDRESRAARVMSTSGAPSALAKSCAESPIRFS